MYPHERFYGIIFAYTRRDMLMKAVVIGCGRWGTFIAWYLDHIGHEVTLYGREGSANMDALMRERKNEYITLPESLHLTNSLEKTAEADVIVISISSQNLQALCETLKPYDLKNKTFVLCMKGIEISTGRRLSQVMEDNMDASNRLAVWLGPGHVEEFYRGIPNCMVIDSDHDETKQFLVEQFSSELIRFYYGTDLIGNEIGAAAKNVIGIAAGMLDGIGHASLKGPLMARGPREIARLIKAMGGNEISAYGLCHLGDYEATLFSEHSHNRMFGERFVKNEPYDKLAEGYYTVKALVALGERYHVDLPICEAVYEMLYEGLSPETALEELFSRSLKSEFV